MPSKWIPTCAWFVAVTLVSQGCQEARRADVKPIERTDEEIFSLMNDFSSYHCSAMVTAANALRHAGRERALTLLTRFATNYRDNMDRDISVALLCRLLFKDPRIIWRPPSYGTEPWIIRGDPTEAVPTFPFIYVRGVPILLVRGFDLFGNTLEPNSSLETARTMSLIETDYPETGFEEAVSDPLVSKVLKTIYPEEGHYQEMLDVVKERAK